MVSPPQPIASIAASPTPFALREMLIMSPSSTCISSADRRAVKIGRRVVSRQGVGSAREVVPETHEYHLI